MKLDEIKNMLLTSHDEGVDTAAAYDTVLSEVSRLSYENEDLTRSVADLTAKLNEITNTNLKLLEKVKYMEGSDESEPEQETEMITIDNLFEEV